MSNKRNDPENLAQKNGGKPASPEHMFYEFQESARSDPETNKATGLGPSEPETAGWEALVALTGGLPPDQVDERRRGPRPGADLSSVRPGHDGGSGGLERYLHARRLYESDQITHRVIVFRPKQENQVKSIALGL